MESRYACKCISHRELDSIYSELLTLTYGLELDARRQARGVLQETSASAALCSLLKELASSYRSNLQ